MKYLIALLLFASAAHAADAPKTYVLSADQAAVVAQWAAEKKAAAQQVYSQADDIFAAIQKQVATQDKPDSSKK